MDSYVDLLQSHGGSMNLKRGEERGVEKQVTRMPVLNGFGETLFGGGYPRGGGYFRHGGGVASGY